MVSLFEFPWRFLMCIMFGSSVLMGAVLFICPIRWQRHVMVATGAMLIAFNLGFCYQVKYHHLEFTETKSFLTNSFPEDNGSFLPIWVKNLDLTPPPTKFTVWQGQADIIDNHKGSGLDWNYQVHVKEPSLMRFNSYYYPGWNVLVDGQRVEILKENPDGVIAFMLFPGEHHVQIHWGTIPSREIAQWISLIAVAILAMMVLLLIRLKGRIFFTL